MSTVQDAAAAEQQDGPTATVGWVPLVYPSDGVDPDPPLRSRRVYAQVIAITMLVVIAVSIVGSIASLSLAENEGIYDAQERTILLADTVIQPTLENGIAEQDPEAIARLDRVVKKHVQTRGIVRLKLWTADGTIVYSDESQLIGETFPLGADELEAMADGRARSEVSTLEGDENKLERDSDKLVEVYLPVETPDGQPLLFETYSDYEEVTKRAIDIWRGFAGITFSSLLLLVVLLLPLLWRLLDRVSRFQTQREALLQRAVDASSRERRRIAATLHDGVVQELAATSFVISGAALRADGEGRSALARSLTTAANTVRTSIGGLRSLLVEIYPPSLTRTGLEAALRDLAASLRTRNIDVRIDLGAVSATLYRDTERLVFQIAQE